MAIGPKDHRKRRHVQQDALAATQVTDAAVRRAQVESRQDMLGFLRRRLGSREEAEEVLQRFSVRTLERAAELRDTHTVRGWLGRILASTIVDYQRRVTRSRRREVPMEHASIESLSVEPDVELDGVVCNCLYKLLPTSLVNRATVSQQASGRR